MSAPQESRGGRYKRLAAEDARRRGLSSEEYGVYKGSEGSLVKPVNSASGLLVLSIILTVIAIAVLYFIGVLIAQSLGLAPVVAGDSEVTPVMWVFIIGYFVFPVWSWIYYAKERRAQKLRIARGLPRNLS